MISGLIASPTRRMRRRMRNYIFDNPETLPRYRYGVPSAALQDGCSGLSRRAEFVGIALLDPPRPVSTPSRFVWRSCSGSKRYCMAQPSECISARHWSDWRRAVLLYSVASSVDGVEIIRSRCGASDDKAAVAMQAASRVIGITRVQASVFAR